MSNQNQKLACSALREAAKMLRLKDCGAHAEQCEKAADQLELDLDELEDFSRDYLKQIGEMTAAEMAENEARLALSFGNTGNFGSEFEREMDVCLEEFADSGIFGRFSE